MIGGKRVLALVPARRGSKGLPLKNIKPLHGKPLLAWPVAAAKGSRYVDRTIVSTDDEAFAQIARDAGAETPFLRPAELAGDKVPSIAFILHALNTLEAAGDVYEYLVLLEPTSPLTESSDVDAALEALHAHAGAADALVGVAQIAAGHPAYAVRMKQDGLVQPYAYPSFADMPLRRQDIETLYALEGSLYISTTSALRRTQGFCHDRTLAHVMPRYKSFEVDDYIDFVCVEAIMAQRDKIKALGD